MARFAIEQTADGYWLVLDRHNDDKLCLKTVDKEIAERQRDHLNRGNPKGFMQPVYPKKVGVDTVALEDVDDTDMTNEEFDALSKKAEPIRIKW